MWVCFPPVLHNIIFHNKWVLCIVKYNGITSCGVSWPSGLAYRTQVLVLAECGFESRPWHLCPWARHLIIIASLHPGVKWVPVRAELVDYPRPYMRCNGSNWAVYSPGSWDGFRNDVWALWAAVIMRLEHHLVGGYVRYISPYIIIIIIMNSKSFYFVCVCTSIRFVFSICPFHLSLIHSVQGHMRNI